jgi:16S rRNA (cytosine967-C5)-methyltransferase
MQEGTEGRRKSRANAGRIAAARALVAVDEGEHVEDVLAQRAPADGPDRALAWHIALGVLRHRGQVDAALAVSLSRPLENLDPGVRAALRVGAFERMFSRTPPHAAVDQAVELARALGCGRASGMVNAVVRRAELPKDLGRVDSLNHPAWLIDRWTKRYGAEITDAWCAANNAPAPLVLVTTGDPAELQTKLEEIGATVAPVVLHGTTLEGALRVTGQHGRVENLPGYHTGEWWVQGAASIAVADLVPRSAHRVLDACAAPGGKTFRLAVRGHEVYSVDVAEERLDMLEQSARRLRTKTRVRQHDWESGPMDRDELFDAVLVDAPCTGLGVLRKHPEIRWRREPNDPNRASRRQSRVLCNAAFHVKSGGCLVYAVCSPEPEEGIQVVEAFLRQNERYQLETKFSTAPPEGDEDGFFAARLRLS